MKFKVGDVCIFVTNGVPCQENPDLEKFDGCEVLIKDVHPHNYTIEWPDGSDGWAFEEHLRKRPPKQGTTTWEDIQQITGWVPNKQGVES